MLARLRAKLIALVMGMVFLILALSFSALCLFDYNQDVADIQEALQSSLAHVDSFARDHYGFESAKPHPQPPEIGGRPEGGPIIPVAVYAVGPDWSEPLPTRMTASLSESVLADAVDAVRSRPEGFGQLPQLGLYFEKRSLGDVEIAAFADASFASGWEQLAISLAGVGLAVLAAVFAISCLFSRWALRPVEEAWRRQRQFVSDASHDLRTPLTVILANNAILLKHPGESVESQSAWVQSTQHEACRMQAIVEDLLTLAKLDEAAADPKRRAAGGAAVDLSDLVEGQLLQFESLAYEQGVSLRGRVDAGIFVKGDEGRLSRLVATLVDNACKYAAAGSDVVASLSSKGRTAVLTVHNDGAPIDPADLPHIFDRFYRADKARSGESGGHGLGLSIARAVAEEHGGAVSAESSAQAGTTFTVKLPLARTA